MSAVCLESENAMVLDPTLPLFLLACASACVRACVRACVCVCVCACVCVCVCVTSKCIPKRTLGDKSNKWPRFSMFFVL